MDFAAIQAAALAARTFSHTLDQEQGITITMVVPTEEDSLLASCDVGLGDTRAGPAALLLLRRRLLERGVRGWQGLRVSHIVPGHPDGATPLAWQAELVPLLLDAQPAWAGALGDALVQRTNDRRAAAQDQVKN